MGALYVFKIVQIAPNWSKRHIFHFVIYSQLLLFCFLGLVGIIAYLNDETNILCTNHLKYYFYAKSAFVFYLFLFHVT